jgi:ABC-2 type transport system permease protein
VTGVLRAELLKLRTTRTTLGLALAMLALVCFAVLLHGFGLEAGKLHGRDEQMKVFGWGELGGLFAGLLSALSITAEIRHGTIRPTLLFTPRRGRVIAGKLAAGALAGIFFGLIAEAVAIAIGSAALSSRAISVRLDGSDYTQLLLGGAAAAALWAAIGLGLGALLRNQVATVVGLCAWLLFVESLLLAHLPGAGRYLPGAAAAALAGASITGQVRPTLLAPTLGAILLILYATATAGAAAIATIRRDVA